VHGAVCRTEFVVNDVVEYRFEVIEEDSVGGAFEDEGEAPIRVYATAGGNARGAYGGIGEEESDGEKLVTMVNEIA
jgi:hypothetical protein